MKIYNPFKDKKVQEKIKKLNKKQQFNYQQNMLFFPKIFEENNGEILVIGNCINYDSKNHQENLHLNEFTNILSRSKMKVSIMVI